MVKDLDSLLKALLEAAKGQVVFIPGDVEIDLTAWIYIEKLVLAEVPEGVTLCCDRVIRVQGAACERCPPDTAG